MSAGAAGPSNATASGPRLGPASGRRLGWLPRLSRGSASPSGRRHGADETGPEGLAVGPAPTQRQQPNFADRLHVPRVELMGHLEVLDRRVGITRVLTNQLEAVVSRLTAWVH